MKHNQVVYDIESYPNIFSICISDGTDTITYEISSRKNEFNLVLKALLSLKQQGSAMVGFNNINYDYPVLHDLLLNASGQTSNMKGEDLAYAIFLKSDSIIKSPYGSFTSVYQSEVTIPQIDILKINHFDNKNRRTSLKCLEFKMRSSNLQDLPFTPGKPIEEDSMDDLIVYNQFDVEKTLDFYNLCLPAIEFRMELGEKLGMDIMNYNDTKIGAEYMVSKLEAQLGSDICYTKKGRKKVARQTKRPEIVLADVIDDRVHFKSYQLNAIHGWLYGQVITETKGVFSKIDLLNDASQAYLHYAQNVKTVTKVRRISDGEVLYTYRGKGSKARLDKINSEYQPDEIKHELISKTCDNLSVMFNDVELVYGLGGLHGSLKNQHIKSDDDWLIIDADVTSYYPSTCVTTGAYPEHLTEHFVPIYKSLIEERLQHPKGSVENAALKLALNGVYGKTNDKYSPFYDPQCTMQITLNGQLFLSMLIEQIVFGLEEDVQLIQANTDGITVRVKRDRGADLAKIFKGWCQLTELKLEYVAYNDMYIRDVNNYVAVKQDGSIKAVGAYKDPVPPVGDWAKNHNHLVVYKTAVKCMLNPELKVEDEVKNHEDVYDFMFYFKGGGRTFKRLELHPSDSEGFDSGQVIQKRSRFLVTTTGHKLYKVLTPTVKNPDNDRYVGEKAGRLVTLCNNVDDIGTPDIDYDFYIKEVNKLLQFKE